MPDWSRFIPTDFEYDFERDKLSAHGIEFEEAYEWRKAPIRGRD
jgi:hypothetical protein